MRGSFGRPVSAGEPRFLVPITCYLRNDAAARHSSQPRSPTSFRERQLWNPPSYRLRPKCKLKKRAAYQPRASTPLARGRGIGGAGNGQRTRLRFDATEPSDTLHKHEGPNEGPSM